MNTVIWIKRDYNPEEVNIFEMKNRECWAIVKLLDDMMARGEVLVGDLFQLRGNLLNQMTGNPLLKVEKIDEE